MIKCVHIYILYMDEKKVLHIFKVLQYFLSQENLCNFPFVSSKLHIVRTT